MTPEQLQMLQQFQAQQQAMMPPQAQFQPSVSDFLSRIGQGYRNYFGGASNQAIVDALRAQPTQ
jgi:hypothetical protein